MVEMRVCQLERDAFDAEHSSDGLCGARMGARAEPHPELLPPWIEDAVAGALEPQTLGQLHHLVEMAARLQRKEGGAVDRFLTLAFGMAEPR